MFGGYIFPFFGAIYYWFPKMSGKKLNEFWGKVHFFLMFPAFMVMMGGQLWVGLHGMRRRIAGYDAALGFENTHLWIKIAGFVIFAAVLIFITNIIVTLRRGEVAEGNVWRSRSLEWQIPNPAPLHNYPTPPVVVGHPYDYGLEGEGSVYVNMNPEAAPVGD